MFADDKLKVAKIMCSVFDSAEKQCRKRRKCWLPAFSPFPTMFSKGFFLRVVKSQDCEVKSYIFDDDLSSLTIENLVGTGENVETVFFPIPTMISKGSFLWIIDTFQNKPRFLHASKTGLLKTRWEKEKTMWEKEKLLVTSNFSFSHTVF